jgi:hypothetical protein
VAAYADIIAGWTLAVYRPKCSIEKWHPEALKSCGELTMTQNAGRTKTAELRSYLRTVFWLAWANTRLRRSDSVAF